MLNYLKQIPYMLQFVILNYIFCKVYSYGVTLNIILFKISRNSYTYTKAPFRIVLSNPMIYHCFKMYKKKHRPRVCCLINEVLPPLKKLTKKVFLPYNCSRGGVIIITHYCCELFILILQNIYLQTVFKFAYNF